MPIELKMPALSPSMEKGTLAKWLVAIGDVVKPGDLIAEIETDKATMELESVDEGRIASLVVPEGTNDVAVGTTIATIADVGDAAPQTLAREETSAIVRSSATTKPVLETAASELVSEDKQTQVTPPHIPVSPLNGVNLSPLALRIAQAKGIDVNRIRGSGLDGRIVGADLGIGPLVMSQPISTLPLASQPPATRTAPPPPNVPVESIKLSSMRKTIARRLSQSKQTVPHFYLTARCDLDSLLSLRVALNASLGARDIKLSVNDMLLKAMALALVEVPDANVQFGGDELYRFRRADISMAVAIEGGLVTPVIEGADTLSLSAISVMSKSLAAKARDGKLLPTEIQGGTASFSNLGMFGIDEMFPVINPPQALILGVGAAVQQPWKVDGTIGLATIVAATASFDHRAIDGAIGARFMAALRGLVEEPMRLLA